MTDAGLNIKKQPQQSGNFTAPTKALLVHTQNNAPAPSGKAFSTPPSLTLERMQEVLREPQTCYIENGKLTVIDPETGEDRKSVV